MKLVLGTIASLILTGAASAAGWKASDDKGLKIYNLDVGSLHLTLVCDPEGAYEPSQRYLLVDVDGRRFENGLFYVARANKTVSLRFAYGAAFPQDNNPHWEQATNAFFAGGAVALRAGGKEAAVNLDALGANTCLK